MAKFGFPNTYYRGTINIYYWVENDLSAAIGIFIPILILKKGNILEKFILSSLATYIIAFNGSRIVLIALVIFFILNLFGKTKIAGLFSSLVLLSSLFLILKNYELGGNTIEQLTIEPIARILNLNPYNRIGSIYDRTNAVIYGLIELKNTWGFGIGPGNSTLMMKTHMEGSTAESMHNFFLQLYVEYGWFFLLSSTALFSFVLKKRNQLGIVRHEKLLYFLITAILISLSQSEGLFSNYYFFSTLYLSFFYIKN